MQQFSSFDSEQVKEYVLDSPDVREEISFLKESLNQTRTEILRLRRRVDRQQVEADSHVLHARALWVVTLLVAAGLTAVAWYAFYGKEMLVARLPVSQTLATGVASGVAGSAGSVERPLPAALAASPKTESGSTIPPVSAEAADQKDSTKDLRQNAGSSIPSQSGREGAGRSTGEVIGLRNAGFTSNPGPSLNSSRSEIRSDVQPSADSVKRTRIDFELSRNKTEEVSPGIFLTVRDTNVDRQQFNGWLQIAEDGRTVWFRDQGAKKVLSFATKRDERSRELVFTRINKEGVAGYLLIPITAG